MPRGVFYLTPERLWGNNPLLIDFRKFFTNKMIWSNIIPTQKGGFEKKLIFGFLRVPRKKALRKLLR